MNGRVAEFIYADVSLIPAVVQGSKCVITHHRTDYFRLNFSPFSHAADARLPGPPFSFSAAFFCSDRK